MKQKIEQVRVLIARIESAARAGDADQKYIMGLAQEAQALMFEIEVEA